MGDEPPFNPDEDTQSIKRSRAIPSGKYQLLVITDGVFSTRNLPTSGTVTLGRGEECSVRIEHPTMSRLHARLTLGDPVTISDCGSRNGVWVGPTCAEVDGALEVHPGDAVQLGGVLVFLQRLSTAATPRRIRNHDYFEGRVEEECARATRSGGTFVIVHVAVPVDTPGGVTEEALSVALRAHDVIATYSPGEYEVLIDATELEAAPIVARIRRSLEERGLDPIMGTAAFPRDGTTSEQLFARTFSAVRSEAAPRDVVSGGAMAQLRALVERVAASDLSVLIHGETGVGKEVLARSIHELSLRASRTFLGLSCAALSESLLESELFGHERGAFTGAIATKPGLFESAAGGTVFLDELGEMPLMTQAKLLRVLEEREVMRVGGLRPRKIDVRFIAATNRDLEEEIARGRFRQDLYFRLNSVSLAIPPLRERCAEILPLADHFLRARAHGRAPPVLSREAAALLLRYSWPGNIRELRNVIDRAQLLCAGALITAEHLPVDKMRGTTTKRATPAPPPPPASSPRTFTARPEEMTNEYPALSLDQAGAAVGGLREEIGALERQRILDTLERCAGNQTQAARLLGISRGTLLSRLTAYDIARPRKPRTR